jgi:nitroreductase
MEFSEILENRFSVRNYIDRPVDDAAVETLLAAIEASPSGANRQSYKICVVRDAAKRKRLSDASGPQGWMTSAPLFLVFFADIDQYTAGMGERLADCLPIQDATIAQAYAQLAATDLGLGSCWVAPFARDSAQQICGIEGNLKMAGILTVGHTTESKPKRKRRGPKEWSVRM